MARARQRKPMTNLVTVAPSVSRISCARLGLDLRLRTAAGQSFANRIQFEVSFLNSLRRALTGSSPRSTGIRGGVRRRQAGPCPRGRSAPVIVSGATAAHQNAEQRFGPGSYLLGHVISVVVVVELWPSCYGGVYDGVVVKTRESSPSRGGHPTGTWSQECERNYARRHPRARRPVRQPGRPDAIACAPSADARRPRPHAA